MFLIINVLPFVALSFVIIMFFTLLQASLFILGTPLEISWHIQPTLWVILA